MVTIKLLAVLKEYAPKDGKDGNDGKNGNAGNDGIVELAFAPGMTVGDALGATGLSGARVKYSVMVNNTRKKPEDPLADGDIIIVMPLLAGG